MNHKAKPFSEVKIGDKTISCDVPDYTGDVLAKGTFTELNKKYNSTVNVEQLLEMDITQEEIDTWPCVAITQDEPGLENFNNLIYFYDCDPCSVMVIEE
jgi:hypothetical protein